MAEPDDSNVSGWGGVRGRILGLLAVDWLGVFAIGGISTVLSVLSAGAAGGFVPEVIVPAVLIPTFIAFPASIVLFRQRRMMADLNARMLDLLRHDPLTGLMSRRFFLAEAEGHRQRGGALLLIDADRFKGINDRFGHPAGDTVLATLGERLRDATGGDVLLGRLGGEEFAAFAPGRSLEAGRQLGDAIRKQVRAWPVRTDRGDVAVSVSLGLSLMPPGSTLAAAITAADEALYRAKALGRDRMIVAGDTGPAASAPEHPSEAPTDNTSEPARNAAQPAGRIDLPEPLARDDSAGAGEVNQGVPNPGVADPDMS